MIKVRKIASAFFAVIYLSGSLNVRAANCPVGFTSCHSTTTAPGTTAPNCSDGSVIWTNGSCNGAGTSSTSQCENVFVTKDNTITSVTLFVNPVTKKKSCLTGATVTQPVQINCPDNNAVCTRSGSGQLIPIIGTPPPGYSSGYYSTSVDDEYLGDDDDDDDDDAE